jgi:hypothetical protein
MDRHEIRELAGITMYVLAILAAVVVFATTVSISDQLANYYWPDQCCCCEETSDGQESKE